MQGCPGARLNAAKKAAVRFPVVSHISRRFCLSPVAHSVSLADKLGLILSKAAIKKPGEPGFLDMLSAIRAQQSGLGQLGGLAKRER